MPLGAASPKTKATFRTAPRSACSPAAALVAGGKIYSNLSNSKSSPLTGGGASRSHRHATAFRSPCSRRTLTNTRTRSRGRRAGSHRGGGSTKVSAGTRTRAARSPTAAACTSKDGSSISAAACGTARRRAPASQDCGHRSRGTTTPTLIHVPHASNGSCCCTRRIQLSKWGRGCTNTW